AGVTKPAEAIATHQRIRILHGRHHAFDARFDQRVGARTGSSLMRAWLEIDIKRRAARPFTRLFERLNFSMLHSGPCVITTAHNLSVTHQHGADRRVRTRLTFPPAREIERFAEKVVHGSNNDWMNFSGSNGSRSPAFSPTPT